MDTSIITTIELRSQKDIIGKLLGYNESINEFMGYLQGASKDLIPEKNFTQVFTPPSLLSKSKSQVFWQYTDPRANVRVDYNRAEFEKIFLNQLAKQVAANRDVYTVNFQCPTKDIELNEWKKGFLKAEFLKGVSTKDDNFAVGFCSFDSATGNNIPFTDTDRHDWATRFANNVTKSTKIQDLYILIPSNNRGDNFVQEHIYFHFVPTPREKIQHVNQYIADNRGLVKDKYATEGLGSMNGVGLYEIVAGPQITEHFFVDEDVMSVLQNGGNRTILNTKVQELVGDGLNHIMSQLQKINQDPMIRKSPYVYNDIGWGKI